MIALSCGREDHASFVVLFKAATKGGAHRGRDAVLMAPRQYHRDLEEEVVGEEEVKDKVVGNEELGKGGRIGGSGREEMGWGRVE